MHVLFWGRCDFHIRFSSRDMYWTFWNRPSWSSMVDMGISLNIMKLSLSKMMYDIFGYDHVQWHPPLIRTFTESWPCYRPWRYYWTWPYYQIQVCFRRTFATGAASQQRTLTPPDTWSFPICSNVETILSCACHVSGLWISNIPRYFFCFIRPLWQRRRFICQAIYVIIRINKQQFYYSLSQANTFVELDCSSDF